MIVAVFLRGWLLWGRPIVVVELGDVLRAICPTDQTYVINPNTKKTI